MLLGIEARGDVVIFLGEPSDANRYVRNGGGVNLMSWSCGQPAKVAIGPGRVKAMRI